MSADLTDAEREAWADGYRSGHANAMLQMSAAHRAEVEAARVGRLDANGVLKGALACENPGCGNQYDPIATRWRCPACGFKSSCCEGGPR